MVFHELNFDVFPWLLFLKPNNWQQGSVHYFDIGNGLRRTPFAPTSCQATGTHGVHNFKARPSCLRKSQSCVKDGELIGHVPLCLFMKTANEREIVRS